MIIFKGERRFELTVDERDGEWVVMLRGYVPGRLYPTQHLWRAFGTREAAIDALKRKWQALFPDDDPLIWREPSAMPVQRHAYRHRDSS